MEISNIKLQIKNSVRIRPWIHSGFNAFRCLFGNKKKTSRPISARLDLLVPLTMALFMLALFEPGLQEAFSFDGANTNKISKIDNWRFLKGEKKAPQKWNHIGFDDTAWHSGQGPFGYGVGEFETFLTDMRSNYTRLYVRREFTVNPAAVTEMNLSVLCDGSFIAYLNGIEVVRSNTRLTEPIDISGFAHELLPGKNALAIECANTDIDSKDFVFMPYLEIGEK